MGKQIVVFKGDRVKKGQQLTEGPIIPQEILEVSGPQELQKYLVDESQCERKYPPRPQPVYRPYSGRSRRPCATASP